MKKTAAAWLTILIVLSLSFGCAAMGRIPVGKREVGTGKKVFTVGFFADQYFRKVSGDNWCAGVKQVIGDANKVLEEFNLKAAAVSCKEYDTNFNQLFRYTADEKDRLERRVPGSMLTFYFDDSIQKLEQADYYVLLTNLQFIERSIGHISYSAKAIIINNIFPEEATKIFLHEFGHSVGCEHSDDGNNLMNRSVGLTTALKFDAKCQKKLKRFAQ